MRLALVTLALLTSLGCSSKEATGELLSSSGDTAISSAEGWEYTALELEIHDLINSYRATQGLPALTLNDQEGQLARQHSQDMLRLNTLSHDGVDARFDAMIGTGATAAGENVAYSQGYEDVARIFVDGWIASPPHHENIVGDYTHTGVGVAFSGDTYYGTQLFTKR